MKRASTGWNLPKTSLRPPRGYVSYRTRKSTVTRRAPMEDWLDRREASNAARCQSGYDAKRKKILARKGNHNAVCNPDPYPGVVYA
jgi:hypothetical protein